MRRLKLVRSAPAWPIRRSGSNHGRWSPEVNNPVQTPRRGGPGDGERSSKFALNEELPTGFCPDPRRVLVPIALDDASDAASALAVGSGAELSLLYVFESSVTEANASHIEAEVRRRFSAARVRHPNARLFLRASVVCAQLQAVANALGADLIVTSRDYHRRFLRCLTCAEAGGFCIRDCIDFTDRLR